ncbi:MAG: glycosyltransferase [Hyphomonadaceae bacterium]|nr:glycosyltransferase [Hyphomonadaceae bacterium]
MRDPSAEVTFWGRTPAGARAVHEIHGVAQGRRFGRATPWLEAGGAAHPVDAYDRKTGAFAVVFTADFDPKVSLVLRSGDGAVARVALKAPALAPGSILRARGGGAETIVALAVHNPKPALFARQIASIRAQTATDWRAVVLDGGSRDEGRRIIAETIGDDARFDIVRQERNLGAPGNFAAVLAAAPPCASIALADADDVWRETKLERTRAALLKAGARLAYCDMRVVRENGDVVAETFWSKRNNQWRDLAGILVANTVTSAASVIDPSILRVALPLPETFAKTFHDQWLAACALASGEIAYVDEALYDYVQHDSQDIGYRVARGPAWARDLRNLALAGDAVVRRTVNAPPGAAAWRALTEEVLRIKHLALALRLRCGDIADTQRARALDAVAALPKGRAARALLFSRGAARFARRSDTLGRDWRFLAGALAAP